MLERRKYMAQHATRHADETPLPQYVNSFLNMIPHQYRSSALSWIMGQGMREASKNRRAFAKAYSKKHGFEIGQHEIFSKMAYAQNPKLGALQDQIEQDWFDHDLEPRWVRVQGNSEKNEKKIDAYQINAHLEAEGREPMYYGGVNGLSAYMERGPWIVDPGRDPDDYKVHADSPYDQQGHDLSLAQGDHGIYSSGRKEIDKIKDEIRTAIKDKDAPEEKRLKDKLRQTAADSKGGGNLLKLGLNPRGGYVPTVGTKKNAEYISRSVIDSRNLIEKLYSDILSGKEFSDFDGPEAMYLQELLKVGKLTGTKKQTILRDLMKISKEFTSNDPENILHTKALAKTIFRDLLSRDPSNPGGQYGTWPTANPTLGLDSSGVLGPATIIFVANAIGGANGESVTLDGPNAPTPQNIDALADKLTDLLVDDERGLKTHRFFVDRPYPKTAIGQQRYHLSVDTDALFSNRNTAKTQGKIIQAIAKLNGQPIEVNFRGERTPITGDTIIEKLKGKEQIKFDIEGKIVDPREQGSQLIKIDPKEIENVLKNYELVGKNKAGNVLTYEIPHTGIKKQIKVTKGPNGPTYEEYIPIDEMKVNHDIANPDNEVQEYGRGRYAHIKYGDGSPSIIARRSTNSLGHDEWYKVDTAKVSKNDSPLLHRIITKVNQGLTNLKPEIRPEENIRNTKWGNFIDVLSKDWESLGEGKPPDKYKVPHCVTKAVGQTDKHKGIGEEDNPVNIVQAELMNQISDVRFWFGDLKHKEDTENRGSDVYDLLHGIGLTPEETDEVASFVFNVLFGSPGEKTTKRELIPHDGDELFIYPNSVRQDVYKAFRKNGFDWRVRKAASSYKAWQNKDKKQYKAQGTGGDVDDAPQVDVADDSLERFTNAKGEIDFDAMLKAQEKELYGDGGSEKDDDYDDELYPADDQDDILRKRGDDAIDPSLAGLNQTELKPSNATAGSNYEREANPKGVKRDVESMYSAKFGTEIDKPIFVGRKRLGRQELPDNYKELPAAQGDYDQDNELNFSTAQEPAAQEPAAQEPAAQGDYDQDNELNFSAAPQIFTPPVAPATKAQPDRRTQHNSMNDLLGIKRREHTILKGYDQWFAEQGGGAVYDPKVKAKDGGGFNWWGAVGDPLGVSISGKADTAKSDPTGKEGRLGKSRASGK